MTSGSSLLLFLPFLLYAETHYRFRYLFSLLRKREPEIIADAPHRLEPGMRLPILVLIKDAHHYPVLLKSIALHLSQNGRRIKSQSLLNQPSPIQEKWWWRVYFISMKAVTGWIEADIEFEIEREGKLLAYKNDNYRTSSRKSLSIYVSPNKLPRLPGIQFGDLHTHSTYTDDQVEYGAPPGASQIIAHSLGLSFFAITDHSYDLDDTVDNYLINDPEIPKWKTLGSEARSLNRKFRQVSILVGEEISCRNGRDQNVHLLLLGERKFFRGSGDGAEKWLRTRSENSIAEILSHKGEYSVAFAAHPCEHVPMLQRILLNRGQWHESDWEQDSLAGLQIYNGNMSRGIKEGKNAWVQSLLRGRKIFLLGGNDAHGNFNRFRQIGIPFLTIKESNEHLFGRVRTGVFSGSNSIQSLLRSLRKGMFIVTDGPVACLKAHGGKKSAPIGGSLAAKECRLEIEAVSTQEFGEIASVVLFQGVIRSDRETAYKLEVSRGAYRFRTAMRFKLDQPCYFRLEMTTLSEGSYDGFSHFCVTNPIWVTPPSPKHK